MKYLILSLKLKLKYNPYNLGFKPYIWVYTYSQTQM